MSEQILESNLNTAIPLMGLESPSGIVHIAGDPLLCGADGNFADWFECDSVPLKHACQRCLRMYLANVEYYRRKKKKNETKTSDANHRS